MMLCRHELVSTLSVKPDKQDGPSHIGLVALAAVSKVRFVVTVSCTMVVVVSRSDVRVVAGVMVLYIVVVEA